MWPLWLVEMSLQHIQKNSPRLLPKPAKFEKNPPNGYRVIRKTKCGAAFLNLRQSNTSHSGIYHLIDQKILSNMRI